MVELDGEVLVDPYVNESQDWSDTSTLTVPAYANGTIENLFDDTNDGVSASSDTDPVIDLTW